MASNLRAFMFIWHATLIWAERCPAFTERPQQKLNYSSLTLCAVITEANKDIAAHLQEPPKRISHTPVPALREDARFSELNSHQSSRELFDDIFDEFEESFGFLLHWYVPACIEGRRTSLGEGH